MNTQTTVVLVFLMENILLFRCELILRSHAIIYLFNAAYLVSGYAPYVVKITCIKPVSDRFLAALVSLTTNRSLVVIYILYKINSFSLPPSLSLPLICSVSLIVLCLCISVSISLCSYDSLSLCLPVSLSVSVSVPPLSISLVLVRSCMCMLSASVYSVCRFTTT